MIKKTLLRKSLHFLIALSPALASLCYPLAVLALSCGTLVYAWAEALRSSGSVVPLISRITVLASHNRDKSRFVLGPVTLGFGALLALLFLPHVAASIGIYALAFGDGLAGVVGPLAGRFRPRFLRGKSVEGSLACFAAVFTASELVTHNVPNALACALVATVLEALPAEDFDNIIIPLGVGCLASFLLA